MNKDIDSAPESVNTDPYGKGWMIKATIENEAELADLLSADAYKALIGA
jgi:glycine cleavage system H protein